MPVLISLLRGVNLGGHRKVPMERLRKVYESLGFRNVRTYVQSGNVVFETGARNTTKIAKMVEEAIEREFGFHSDVVVRTAEEWKDAVAANPFAARPGVEPSKLLVSFLASAPAPEGRRKVLAAADGKEELHLLGREMYIYFPDGLGRPQLSFAAIDKALGVPATGRNWNTVVKLLEMAESGQ